MKTIIITALAVIALTSCKKETPQSDCTCNEVYEKRYTGAVIYWEFVSQVPVDVECWRHLEITEEWQTTSPVNLKITYHRKQIICE